MIIKLRIEEMKDFTGIKKQVGMVTITTEIPGLESINAVMEIPKDSVLDKEIKMIVTDMMEKKQAELKIEHKNYKSKTKVK